jgi:pimeloyl-ACP methyl ester carboxylesterase
LVLIHGLGSRRGAWRPVADRIAPQREVVGVDLPGFGDSPPDGTPPAVDALSQRLQGFFGELGLERPHVAGNSLGGAVALELGRRGAARSVTAFSPVGFAGRTGTAWCRAALGAGHAVGRLDTGRLPRGLRVALARPWMAVYAYGRPLHVPAEEVLAAAESGRLAPAFRDALGQGLAYRFGEPGMLRELPVTVAWGRRDVLLPYATQARRARRALPWARHITLPGCGHVPFFDDPELCARVVLEGSAAP